MAWAFVFGNSMQTVWESFILIFIVRPYDVGDRIKPEGLPVCIVSRINLLSTEAFGPGTIIIIQFAPLTSPPPRWNTLHYPT